MVDANNFSKIRPLYATLVEKLRTDMSRVTTKAHCSAAGTPLARAVALCSALADQEPGALADLILRSTA